MIIRFKQYFNINIIFLVLGLFIIGGYFALLFAEEEAIETYYPQVSNEECLKSFNINNVNFKNPKVTQIIHLLSEYFWCRAAVRDDINECNNLSPLSERVKNCQMSFDEYHGFLGRLWREKRISPEVFNMWEGLGSKEELELAIAGFLKGDTSVCEKAPPADKQDECKAMVSGDVKLCKNEPCRNKAAYFKAIKGRNIKECDKIESSRIVKAMCRGYISMDEKICEENEDFKEFRRRCCEQN
jgi:hypothetical protein